MNDLQILLTTILGSLLVIVAVWQIAVRRDSGRSTAKFLGIELDLSTPGLVVLVVGCGLLVLPAFLSYRPGRAAEFHVVRWQTGGPKRNAGGIAPGNRICGGKGAQ